MKEFPPLNASVSEPIRITDGVIIRAMMVMDVLGPRFQMVLMIDEQTNFDAINKNRRLIRDNLAVFSQIFGTDLNAHHRNTLWGLLKWRQDLGWGRLTMVLNYMCLALTFSAYDDRKTHGLSKTELAESLNFITDPSYLSTFGGVGLSTLYLALGKNLKEFNDWMDQGFRYLDQNELPLEISSEPFSQSTVRDKLRHLQTLITKGVITISKDDLEWNTLDFNIFVLNQRGCFTKIDELLDKARSASWVRNKPLLQEVVLKIFRRWENSQDPNTILAREMYKETWEKS